MMGHYYRTPEYIVEEINNLLGQGYTQEEVCSKVGIARSTIWRLRKRGLLVDSSIHKGIKLTDKDIENTKLTDNIDNKNMDGTPKLPRKETPEYDYPEGDAWKYSENGSEQQKDFQTSNVVQKEVRLHGRFTACNIIPENGTDMYYFDSAHIEIRNKDNAQDIVDGIDMMIKELQEMKMALCAGVYR